MSEAKEKHGAAEEILTRSSLFVHLDPRAEGVEVPEWYKRQAQLVLQVGYDMPVPIPDLCVDEQGVFGTLAFHNHTHFCQVPWSAVFALVDEQGKGRVWPGCFPQEIVTEVHKEMVRRQLTPLEGGAASGGSDRSEGGKGAPHPTRLYREGAESPREEPPSPSAAGKKAPGSVVRRDSDKPAVKKELPPYLRVVK